MYDWIVAEMTAMPRWGVLLLFAVISFILVKIYFKIFKKLFIGFVPYMSATAANEKLVILKGVGYPFMIVLFAIALLIYHNLLFLLVDRAILVLIWLIAFAYIKSGFNLMDHLISVKYAPHLVKEMEIVTLCGEVLQENGSYYLDTPMFDDKVKL